jgi:sRNA-binding carbon storage regulator CsrA|tara:strand:- start:359 stop:541 length:183 start_codon:yes stop_codon:yes gene_type:complete
MSNLVLTRRKKDTVVLYNKDRELCRVTVTSLGPKQVKLAFKGHPDIKIDREEIYNLKHKE